jgi:cytochrome c6
MLRKLIPLSAIAILGLAAQLPAADAPSGEEIFKARCTSCHRDGGNIIKKDKTLSRKDLEANNIRTEEDVIRVLRNPGPVMPKYDEKMLSPADARAVARYVLEQFNK